MGKISEIIKVNRALGSEVNLVEELFDKEKNARRMSNYMPTKGHREAFVKIIKGLNDQLDKRAYILNGSYGTGKSNLLLMTANYLMNNSNCEEMTQFFENYFAREEDEKITDLTPNAEEILQKIKENISHLKNMRLTDKPHFVALCKYDVSGDFTEILLRAIKEAFEREQISVESFDSIYHEANRRIKIWEIARNETDFYDKLTLELEKTNRTVELFKSKLENINSEALKEFKEIYKKFTLSDFTYEKDNLTDIIKETIKSKSFTEKYSGFTIFFDEFGDILKNHRFNVLTFQGFTEFCQNSLYDRIPVMFIATTHKSFETYAEYYDKDQFKKVSDRFVDVSLSTEGFEDIMSAIVRPDKESQVWKEKIGNSKEFIELSKKTTSLKLFEGLRGKKLEEKLIKNLYPMHPMATYALLGLSKEISSNNRSVYSFFTRGEFEPYTEENEIETSDRLNFYTAEHLIEYFGREKFKSDNSDLRHALKDKIRNYETSKSEFEKFKRTENIVEIEIYIKIMDIILIYQLLEIPVTEENIYFGLNIKSEEEKKQVKISLEKMQQYGVIYYKKTTLCYEFKQSDTLDVQGIIAEYIRENKGNDINIVEELKKLKENREFSQIKTTLEGLTSSLLPFPTLSADCQYQKDILRIQELESDKFIESKAEKINKQNILTYSVDGYFFYIVCENNKERDRAIKAAENIVEKNIVIAIPKEVTEIREQILGLLATEKSEKLKNLKPQEVLLLESEKKLYVREIVSTLTNLVKSNNIDIFYQGKKENTSAGNKEKKIVTDILETRYGKNLASIVLPLKQRKEDFNSENERSFKEFIERLLSIKEPLLYDSKVVGKADDRYLKILLDSQILIEYETNETGKEILEMNTSISSYNCYPALKYILEKLETENINIDELKYELTQNYALGKYGLYFLLAYIIRYFNGNLSFINSRGTNENISSYKDIEEFVRVGKEIKKIRITEREKEFIDSLYNLFKERGTLQQRGNIKESFEAIKGWYNELKSYQKIVAEREILDIFSKINTLSAEEFLLGELNILIGKERDDLLLENEIEKLFEKIEKFKENCENSREFLKEKLLEEISKRVHKSQDEIYQFFYNYYENLPEFKKKSSFEKHSQESRRFLEFLEMLKSGRDYENLLLNYIGDYEKWSEDNTRNIAVLLDKGYMDMENLFLIPDPEIEFEGEFTERFDNTIIFGDNFKILIKNLDKNTYDTYYIISKDGKSVKESFGTSEIKIAKLEDEISNVKDGDILYLLNQQDSSESSSKKRSNEIKFKFKSKQKQYEPSVEVVKEDKGIKSNESIQLKGFEKIVFDVIPKQKTDLKSSINGLINAVIKNSEIKKEDVKEVLEQLLVEYSRGNK